MENHENKTSMRKNQIFWFRSRLRVRKCVSTLQSPPKGGTLN